MLSSNDTSDCINIIANLKEILPFTNRISSNEKKKLLKFSNDNYNFSKNALEYAKITPDIVPANINLSEIENNLAYYENLKLLKAEFSNILNSIDSEMAITGHKIYKFSLFYYKILKIFADNSNYSHYFKKLNERFEGQGKKKSNISTN